MESGLNFQKFIVSIIFTTNKLTGILWRKTDMGWAIWYRNTHSTYLWEILSLLIRVKFFCVRKTINVLKSHVEKIILSLNSNLHSLCGATDMLIYNYTMLLQIVNLLVPCFMRLQNSRRKVSWTPNISNVDNGDWRITFLALKVCLTERFIHGVAF